MTAYTGDNCELLSAFFAQVKLRGVEHTDTFIRWINPTTCQEEYRVKRDITPAEIEAIEREIGDAKYRGWVIEAL